MSRRAVYLPDALADLHQIWAYLADQSQSGEAASRLIDAIDDRAQLYAENPELGTPRFELAPGVRCFSVARYVALYLPTQWGIEIIQVIHGSRDIPEHFRNMP